MDDPNATEHGRSTEAASIRRPEAQRAAETRARVEALLEQLTVEEKLSLVITNFPTIAPRLPDLSTEELRSRTVPSAGYNAGVPRLGIPELKETDAGLGVANPMDFRTGDTATAFPAALATAASFSTKMAFAGGAAAGADARAKGFNVLLAGGANLTRDPWAGRNFEYLGEDPLLSGLLAGNAIAGVQSNRIASTVKHFVLNPQETGRMVMDARIDESALRESDLLGFQIAIETGRPASVMSAYNRINGTYASEHHRLNVEILKEEWGFDGWVMSDWGGVHSTEAAATGGLDQESGIELDMALNGAVFFTDALATALRDGRISHAKLDDMVRRILTGLARCGALDGEPADPVDRAALAAAAEEIAIAGMTLLRNGRSLLPLGRSARRVLLVGGHADVGVLSGGGSSQVLSNRGNPIEIPMEASAAAWYARTTFHGSSPLEALRDLAPDTEFSFVSGEDVAEAAVRAAAADVVIVFATQWMTEGVDADNLSLPHDQDALIDRVSSANPNTVVVLEVGGPVLMPWLDKVSAVLVAWYPGERGGEAIAKVLIGDVAPSGRLPITFPASEHQAPRPTPPGIDLVKAQAKGEFVIGGTRLPEFAVDYHEGANVGYRWYELAGHVPLFPFGFGLSYTDFVYEALVTTHGDRPTVSFRITNVGTVAGCDVPQVYVRAAGSDGRTSWRLAGFERVSLEAGESRRVTIGLEPRCYAMWCTRTRGWRPSADELPLVLAKSARDHVLSSVLRPLAD